VGISRWKGAEHTVRVNLSPVNQEGRLSNVLCGIAITALNTKPHAYGYGYSVGISRWKGAEHTVRVNLTLNSLFKALQHDTNRKAFFTKERNL